MTKIKMSSTLSLCLLKDADIRYIKSTTK